MPGFTFNTSKCKTPEKVCVRGTSNADGTFTPSPAGLEEALLPHAQAIMFAMIGGGVTDIPADATATQLAAIHDRLYQYEWVFGTGRWKADPLVPPGSDTAAVPVRYKVPKFITLAELEFLRGFATNVGAVSKTVFDNDITAELYAISKFDRAAMAAGQPTSTDKMRQLLP